MKYRVDIRPTPGYWSRWEWRLYRCDEDCSKEWLPVKYDAYSDSWGSTMTRVGARLAAWMEIRADEYRRQHQKTPMLSYEKEI